MAGSLLVQIGAMGEFITRGWPYLRFPVTLLALIHLVLVAVLPGGKNLLFGIYGSDTPGYLSLFQAQDTFGFYATRGKDGFLIYKIFTQSGKVVEEVFPNDNVLPRLRFDRWAVAGDAAARSYPKLHALVTRYILKQFPSPPLRLELYSARWIVDRNSLHYPWPGEGPRTKLNLELIGTYNGLTRSWQPVPPKTEDK